MQRRRGLRAALSSFSLFPGLMGVVVHYTVGEEEQEAVVVGEMKIRTAEDATEAVISFFQKHYPFLQPLKAEKQDGVWVVEVDVGALKKRVIRARLSAATGQIEEYAEVSGG